MTLVDGKVYIFGGQVCLVAALPGTAVVGVRLQLHSCMR
jgi:hypothetical protein